MEIKLRKSVINVNFATPLGELPCYRNTLKTQIVEIKMLKKKAQHIQTRQIAEIL
jgi:hypothetical protein